MLKKKMNFKDSINSALAFSLKKDKNMICYGLGINDPKSIFGTTKNLSKKFGQNRVFDVPTSENALTGIAVGAAISGIRTVITHQRLDFSLLSMDQIVNSAAKWRYMFGGKLSVPITIRMILGRGWGQGPTHSQNLAPMFCNIPGLKVFMPTFADDAKRLLIKSIFDPNPVIFLEHRWLHELKDEDFLDKKPDSLSSNIVSKGSDLTLISMSYLTLEALKAKKILKKIGINIEVIDLISLKPLNISKILKSIKKTNRVLILDTGFPYGSISSEILSLIYKNLNGKLKTSPISLTMPDIPEPTSFFLTKNLYIDHIKVVKTVLKMFKKSMNLKKLKKPEFHDVPGTWFKGPF